MPLLGRDCLINMDLRVVGEGVYLGNANELVKDDYSLASTGRRHYFESYPTNHLLKRIC